jgi:hypothetical protein
MTPSADRADTQAPRRGWPRWVWIVAPVALMVLLACCGFGVYQLVQQQQAAAAEERAKAAEEMAKADALKYGIEDDAKAFALEVLSRGFMSLGMLGGPGLAQFGPATAKLDRETGHWTVTGPYLQKDLNDRAIPEDLVGVNWEVIAYYAPTERPDSNISPSPHLAGWHMVSYTILEQDIDRLPDGQLSFKLRLKFHPAASKDNGEAK